ncbi:uncharacterized protein MONBRDRAFT_32443 [Monosiga brevicollis MX1]|uniref:Uncharacterized protein n=1 Tax=Monosiga brevicollis TaxID=81824 RepID=A9UZJ0_MONBE|nr:uncharacterized protein MONBRDRAFT_32443 [Monosiga brevicollis MX1]EDQ89239.1 predicted protein [Monosiga brevicollis MX1]|eukprot:XP_001745815.1 hypothetical protein [Monosiga brevicollis MX1]
MDVNVDQSLDALAKSMKKAPAATKANKGKGKGKAAATTPRGQQRKQQQKGAKAAESATAKRKAATKDQQQASRKNQRQAAANAKRGLPAATPSQAGGQKKAKKGGNKPVKAQQSQQQQKQKQGKGIKGKTVVATNGPKTKKLKVSIKNDAAKKARAKQPAIKSNPNKVKQMKRSVERIVQAGGRMPAVATKQTMHQRFARIPSKSMCETSFFSISKVPLAGVPVGIVVLSNIKGDFRLEALCHQVQA